MSSSRLAAAFAAIDAANSADPDCLLYGQRMTSVLAEIEPAPSDELAIAARAQHIRRFEVPRDSYPQGLVGYKKWRADLGRFHAELAATIATDVGYSVESAERIAAIIRKLRLSSDEEVQALEDTACVVFVRYHLGDFAARNERDKVIRILRKTWAKMSRVGHAVAIDTAPSAEVAELIREARGEAP